MNPPELLRRLDEERRTISPGPGSFEQLAELTRWSAASGAVHVILIHGVRYDRCLASQCHISDGAAPNWQLRGEKPCGPSRIVKVHAVISTKGLMR